MSLTKTEKIAVLGLGYVGLPLALGLARAGFDVVGFDTNSRLVARLLNNDDPNGEVSSDTLAASTALFTDDAADLAESTAFILGVPTPITDTKEPVLGACGLVVIKDIMPDYRTEVILAGRRINDHMGRHVAQELIKRRAFQEDCADIHNSRVVDIVDELKSYSASVDIWAPWVDPEAVDADYGYALVDPPENGVYDAVVVASAHRQFREMDSAAIRALGKPEALLYDIKGVLPKSESDWRL